jgi:hypothetical protein
LTKPLYANPMLDVGRDQPAQQIARIDAASREKSSTSFDNSLGQAMHNRFKLSQQQIVMDQQYIQ